MMDPTLQLGGLMDSLPDGTINITGMGLGGGAAYIMVDGGSRVHCYGSNSNQRLQ